MPCSSSPTEILRAQEVIEDQRLLAKATQIQQENERYSCIDDDETTPWLKHTRWPDWFRHRPLDVITATAQMPNPRALAGFEDFSLGRWQGAPLVSPASNEAKLVLLMQAADQMFARAESTLRRTPYRLCCWLKSYHRDTFYPKAVDVLHTQAAYFALWKQFLCYVFRVLAIRPSQRKRIYGLQLQPDEVRMMEHILSLLDSVGDQEESQRNAWEGEDVGEYDMESSEDGSSVFDLGSEADTNVDADSESESGEDSDSSFHRQGCIGRGGSSFVLPSRGERRLSEALSQLSMMFWTYRDLTGDMTSSTLIHFVGVLGIHRHSLAYKSAYNSTPCFSRLIWLGRLFFLEYALPLYPYTTLAYPWPARNAYPDQAGRLEEIHTKYLLRGSLGLIAEILELKAFAKAIVKREGVR